MGRFGFPITVLAASVISFDMFTTFIAVEIYGGVELNPIYHLFGYLGLLLANTVVAILTFLLEYTYSSIPEWSLLRIPLIAAVFFRLGLILPSQIGFWLQFFQRGGLIVP